MSVLALNQLTTGYQPARRDTITVTEKIDITLEAGEMVCLIGPNGAGKTTLMRTIAGIQPPLSGSVTLNGEDIRHFSTRELAQQLSIVLTERVDVGLLTAFALVGLGRHPYTSWSGTLSAHDEAVAQWALQAVGAEALAQRYIGELSDGERQKVMIARALAQEPSLMLLDEPTAFLDLPRRVEMMSLLRQLAHQTGKAILLSTHDLDLALRSADRIWLLPAGGRLQAGAPEDLVLSGAFAEAFRSEGVDFDMQTGSFKIHGATGGRVTVSGEGVHAVWTQRALERAGFITERNGGQPLAQVEILRGETLQWRLHAHGTTDDFPTIYALIEALRATLDAKPLYEQEHKGSN